MAMLASPSGAALAPLVTHDFPLSDYRQGLAVAAGRAGHSAVKVALTAP
jgi:hypothetical protein